MKFLFFPLLMCMLIVSNFNVRADERVVISIDGNDITADEFSYSYKKNTRESTESLTPREYARLYTLFKMKVMEATECGIDTTRKFIEELNHYCSLIPTDDSTLQKEYREGMLMFEISDRRVWQKSLTDHDEMASLFDSNKSKYGWEEPRAKGWLIFADDSITAGEACRYIETLAEPAEDIRPVLKEKFSRSVMADKILAKKGVNKVVDSLVFDSGEAFTLTNGWKVVMPCLFRIIIAPEDWKDVRNEVASDYQNKLAESWESELWDKHNVVFHYEVIDEMADL